MTAAQERRTMARLSVAAGSAATLAAAWLGILRIEGGPPPDASAEVAREQGIALAVPPVVFSVLPPTTVQSSAVQSSAVPSAPVAQQPATASPAAVTSIPATIPATLLPSTPASLAPASTLVPAPTPAATVAPRATAAATPMPRIITRRSRAS